MSVAYVRTAKDLAIKMVAVIKMSSAQPEVLIPLQQIFSRVYGDHAIPLFYFLRRWPC